MPSRGLLTRWLPCAQGYNAEILSVGLLLAMLLVFFTAMLLCYLRPPDPTDPAFESIPATLYLALLMLCGQGQPEGDLPFAPTTFVWRLLCLLVAGCWLCPLLCWITAVPCSRLR